jgi:sphingolipid delta-4 desaturase
MASRTASGRRAQPRSQDKVGSFTWSETDEPHATRRKIILAAHPEIAELFTTEPLTFWISLGILALQLTMAWLLRDSEWYVILPCAYVIGGTVNHSLQLAVHELSHDLCWAGPNKDATNRLTAIMANLATCIPSGQTFKPYHMDHHQYQGVDGVDTDIPHAFEVNYVTNTVMKILWILAQPLCYALRPMLIKPKPFRFWEGLNWAAQLSFNAAVLYFLGTRSFTYLITGTLLGLGLHPSAGHFIAEHYEFVAGAETYSYYGPANYFNFNVGYHNEHHDFPKVPWSKLPRVREIAPEFYDSLPSYTSYVTEVFWPYITDPEMGCFCRIKRKTSAKVYEALDRTTDKRKYAPMKIACFVGLIGAFVFMLAQLLFGVSGAVKTGVSVVAGAAL